MSRLTNMISSTTLLTDPDYINMKKNDMRNIIPSLFNLLNDPNTTWNNVFISSGVDDELNRDIISIEVVVTHLNIGLLMEILKEENKWKIYNIISNPKSIKRIIINMQLIEVCINRLQHKYMRIDDNINRCINCGDEKN